MKVKPDRPPPPFIKLGAGAHYTRLDILGEALGASEDGIRSLCATFGLPLCHFPGMTAEARYVLTYAFESAMFELGLPKKIKERPELVRVHQELSGVLYGSLTKEALRERVIQLAKVLTSAGEDATISRKRTRKGAGKGAHGTWRGRKPNG